MPISAATSNSFKVCRQVGHSRRCARRSFCSSSVRSPEVEMAHSSRNLSCGPIPDHPSLSQRSLLFSMPMVQRHSIPKHLLTQLIQSAVVVVAYISQGLAQFLADLHKRITIEEVQAQGFPLVFRQGFEHLVETITPKHGFCGIIALSGRCSDQMSRVAIELRSRIEPARREIPAPLNGPVVRHLDDPGTCRAFGTIKDGA